MNGFGQTDEGRLAVPQTGRIAIIAGSGKLPVTIARCLENQGRTPLLVIVQGETDSSLKRLQHIELPIEHIGELSGKLKAAGVTHLVFAGGISRRPPFTALKPSFALVRFAYKAVQALSRGDDKLLRTIIEFFEADGFIVVGAHEIVPEILTRPGMLSRRKPTRADMRDIGVARSALALVGPLDLGQAAVAIGGRVVAIEGPEGTDAMLRRVAEMRTAGRLPARAGGVVVKCAKPDQELRADLPSVGPATIENATAARLQGIAVEAGRSLILDREEAIAAADRNGLFLMGLGPDAS